MAKKKASRNIEKEEATNRPRMSIRHWTATMLLASNTEGMSVETAISKADNLIERLAQD